MQRILQPGEIEALDRTSFPRVLLPQPSQLFRDRALRLQYLAAGNPIEDYLLFIAKLIQAQHLAQAGARVEPLSEEAKKRALKHAMPLLPALDHIDSSWQDVLESLLDALALEDGLPAALQPLIQSLRALGRPGREEIARKLLQNEGSARDVGVSPFIMAALQVSFSLKASLLKASELPSIEPPTLCPVCASAPTSSVLHIGGPAAGHRYLHCGLCATEWHMVRVKCSCCESTKGVAYQSVEGGDAAVLAETCSECGAYRKLVDREKSPLADPLADDLASLTLDLLMGETRFHRASPNPLLFVAFAEEQDNASGAPVQGLGADAGDSHHG